MKESIFSASPLRRSPDFSALESELAFNFSPDLRFSLSHVDEGFVSHDLLLLVQRTFELRGHLLFLSSLEGLKALLHFNLKFKRSFFLEQVEVGFVRRRSLRNWASTSDMMALRAAASRDWNSKVEPFGPILLVYALC